MKNKLSFISIFTLCIALSLTACGGKQSSNTDSKNTQTEAGKSDSFKICKTGNSAYCDDYCRCCDYYVSELSLLR